MRPRKRADWPIRVYKYSVRPEYDTWERLPIGAQQEIENARTLWNSLVEAFERRQVRYREIITQGDQPPDKQRENLTRAALSQLQQTFVDEARHLTTQCSATWAYREFILTQFLASVTRFLRKQGRAPHRKHGIPSEVHFHHRFAGGGFAVEGIFGRSQRLRLESPPPEAFDQSLPQRQRKRLARTTGAFQVGDTFLSFQTLLHRPLPAGAYLKTAALIGRQVVRDGYHLDQGDGHLLPSRWVWSLHLTLEQPPHAIVAQERKTPEGTIVLTRREWGEGQLQIGVLVDSTGREEALMLPEAILAAWHHKRELQRKADQDRDETKVLLQEMRPRVAVQGAAHRLLAHVGNVSTPGLWRLLHLLEDSHSQGEMVEIVRRWADRATRLRREVRGLERRYLGHRDWFYHNLALQLCQRYQRLVVATEVLSPPPTQEQEREILGLQNDNTSRQLVSPSLFLAILQQAAAKTGTDLRTIRTASQT